MKQQIYDISIELNSKTPSYPGDPKFIRTLISEKTCTLSKLEMSSHSGTHIDAPAHFIKEGESIDKLDLNDFIIKAHVVEAAGVKSINVKHIRDLNINPGNAVLFKTDNSLSGIYNKKYNNNYVYVEKETAELCVEKGVKLVGIDFLTIDTPATKEHPVHSALLSNNIYILEGIDLSSVPTGIYELICLPLKIKNGDGSPVRAVLIPKAQD
ncbi:MAG: cyclase family protein [Victivallales bacterium]|nr:cyclase family protein [Victivallales bacterium]MCF7888479.1 cyclase family protein [Victivallales bacterium]